MSEAHAKVIKELKRELAEAREALTMTVCPVCGHNCMAVEMVIKKAKQAVPAAKEVEK